MAVTYGFFNSVNGDRKYNADQMSEYFRGIVSQGVFQHLDSGMAVSAGTGLSVSVAAGRAIIQNRWVQNSAALNLTISDASETYGRKDAVVIRLDKSSRAISIAVKTGTPAASPVAPEMTRNATTYEMALAYVNVAAGATSVTVTDKRSDSTVCGWAAVAQATSGEVDQMLNDMKTGFDGVVYPSPAAMVQGCDELLQGEIDRLDEDITYIVDTNLYGKNLFNDREEDAFTYGYALDSDGLPTIANENFKITDYIPVSSAKGSKIAVSWSANSLPNTVRICMYKSDKTFQQLSYTPTASTGYNICDINSNTAYIRISIRKELHNIQVEYSTTVTDYVPGYTANDNNARTDIITIQGLVNKTTYKLIQSDWEQGGIDANGAEVNTGTDYPLRIRTDFIEIGKDSLIDYSAVSSSYYIAVCYYDDDHNFISRTSWINTSQRIDAISSVIRIVARTSTNSAVDPSLYSFWPVVLVYNLFGTTSKWMGKKWVSYGDSITEMGLWQPYVVSKFGLIHTNKGIGGTRVAERGSSGASVNTNWFGADDRINGIPTDTQIITIMGGTNDFGTPPSEIVTPTWDSTNQRFGTYGFQNGLCETIRKIYARIPSVQIVLMSLTGGQYTDNTYDMPQRKNSLGYTGEDYAKATEEVANLLNLPYIPIWNDGINVFNRTLYISDTVHPNAEGAKLIARMVNGWFLTNEPV